MISPAYLTAGNGAEQTPKISMGDDDNRTGVPLLFQVNNLSDREQVYTFGRRRFDGSGESGLPRLYLYGRDLQSLGRFCGL